MKAAALLSDLKSLSVCSHESAINLIKIYQSSEISNGEKASAIRDEPYGASTVQDEDLRRADELVSLHQNVKLKHIQAGPDQDLLQARQAVQAVLASLAREA